MKGSDDTTGIAMKTLLATIVLSSVAAGQTTTRESVDSHGVQGNGWSRNVTVSADGRYIAFSSSATNLVAGDANGQEDVFVRDRLSGSTERVSVSSIGAEANGGSTRPALSADGRFVAFSSDAQNLSAGDTNGDNDVFVHDRLTGTTVRVSVDSNGAVSDGKSLRPSISANGRFVAFDSDASNLVGYDTNGSVVDIFVHDCLTGTTELVSVDSGGAQGNADSYAPSLSADGRYVAFRSWASNLVPGDLNATFDIFVRDRQLGTTERVSVSTGGAESNGPSYDASITPDGRFVTFYSPASNLVSGDTNGFDDVFVRDRQSGSTERVSVASGGAQANTDSYSRSLSIDGRFVIFDSSASTLAPGDTNNCSDVFVRDRQTGTTERVSLDSTGAQGNGYSQVAWISADGDYVAFESAATNLVVGDTNACDDIFVRERTCMGSAYTYCAAKQNSLGCTPSIGSSGLPSLSGPDNFYVTASSVLNQKSGMMLWAGAQANISFHGGVLCLAAPIVRTPLQQSGGNTGVSDCSGAYSFFFSHAYMANQFLGAGASVYCQFWSRDPGFPIPNNIGLTNGLSFTICP